MSCRQGSSAVVLHCTTRRRNAHRTGVERELLYPWHPWAGRQVHIHEVIEKGDAAVFRCSLSGEASDRWLEVPAWMFDRALSASWRITAAPHVDLAVLGALASFFRTQARHRNRGRWAQHWALTTRIGEMSMPRQPTTHQFDLFSNSADGRPCRCRNGRRCRKRRADR